MAEGPLYFRLEEIQRGTAAAKIAFERPDLSTVLAEAAELYEAVQAHRASPGSLEWKRDRLHRMLHALNGLGYRLQQCRSWPELAALLDVALVRRKPQDPKTPR